MENRKSKVINEKLYDAIRSPSSLGIFLRFENPAFYHREQRDGIGFAPYKRTENAEVFRALSAFHSKGYPTFSVYSVVKSRVFAPRQRGILSEMQFFFRLITTISKIRNTDPPRRDDKRKPGVGKKSLVGG